MKYMVFLKIVHTEVEIHRDTEKQIHDNGYMWIDVYDGKVQQYLYFIFRYV